MQLTVHHPLAICVAALLACDLQCSRTQGADQATSWVLHVSSITRYTLHHVIIDQLPFSRCKLRWGGSN